MTRSLTKRQRWTPAEWAEVERRAAAAGVTPSEYVRQQCVGQGGKR